MEFLPPQLQSRSSLFLKHQKNHAGQNSPPTIPMFDEDEMSPDERPCFDDVAILACNAPWELQNNTADSIGNSTLTNDQMLLLRSGSAAVRQSSLLCNRQMRVPSL